jgi:uncharacterized protein
MNRIQGSKHPLGAKRSKRSGRRPGSYRTCVGCNRRLLLDDSLRLVLDNAGQLLPDLFGKLQGRGVHICPNPACFERAQKRGSFSRSMHQNIKTADIQSLLAAWESSLRDQALSMLAISVRCQAVAFGRSAVKEAVSTRKASLLLAAEDCAPAAMKLAQTLAIEKTIPFFVFLQADELSKFHRGKPVAMLAVTHRGLAQRLVSVINKALALKTPANVEWEDPGRKLTGQRV